MTDSSKLQSSEEYTALLGALSDVRSAIAWCDESAKNATRCASLADSAASMFFHSSGSQTAKLPTGTLLPFAGIHPPEGFFLCDGVALSKKVYADLFSVIGEEYGVGDGKETFSLPDLQREPFCFMITRGELSLDYRTKDLFFCLDYIDNTRTGHRPDSESWEDLAGSISLFLNEEEKAFHTLSEEHCEILLGYCKQATETEIATGEGTFSFQTVDGGSICYHNGVRIDVMPDMCALLRGEKDGLFALRLYAQPLSESVRVAHFKTDYLRFFDLTERKGFRVHTDERGE